MHILHFLPSDVYRPFITHGLVLRIVVVRNESFESGSECFRFFLSILRKATDLVRPVFFLICSERLLAFYGCLNLNPSILIWMRGYLEPGPFYLIVLLIHLGLHWGTIGEKTVVQFRHPEGL
jgi:hypothetical protein